MDNLNSPHDLCVSGFSHNSTSSDTPRPVPPKAFVCTICIELMRDPVTVRQTGHHYCKECIDGWLKGVLFISTLIAMFFFNRQNQGISCPDRYKFSIFFLIFLIFENQMLNFLVSKSIKIVSLLVDPVHSKWSSSELRPS